MLVLGLDSATAACSAALWRDGRVVARRFAAMDRGQSEALVPMVADVFGEAKTRAGDLDLIAVTVGPGAFTGVRIGLATARGLGLAAGVPVAGVTTFDAFAHAVQPDLAAERVLAVAVETKRADLYVQLYAQDGSPDGDPRALLPEAMAAWLTGRIGGRVTLAGDGAARALAALGGGPVDAVLAGAEVPPACDAAHVAAVAARRGLPESEAPPPEPLYLQPPHVRAAPRGGALRPA